MKNVPKKYEELTFTDDFIFCKVMQNNENLCKELLEMILGKKIGLIRYPENQKTIEITSDGKGVRLDIYVEDEENVIYDVEMQTSNKRNLPKRSRYYQSMIDLNLIERGADYNQLRISYVIFICIDDYFKKGLHKYTFSNACHELPNLELEDGTRKIFLCANGTKDDVSPEMKAFLNYLMTNQVSEGLTSEINRAVEEARQHENWRLEYMTNYVKYMDMKAEGKEEGKYEALISLVIDGDITVEKAAEKLNVTVEEFKRKMSEIGN